VWEQLTPPDRSEWQFLVVSIQNDFVMRVGPNGVARVVAGNDNVGFLVMVHLPPPRRNKERCPEGEMPVSLAAVRKTRVN
jgi:hypothetical protein